MKWLLSLLNGSHGQWKPLCRCIPMLSLVWAILDFVYTGRGVSISTRWEELKQNCGTAADIFLSLSPQRQHKVLLFHTVNAQAGHCFCLLWRKLKGEMLFSFPCNRATVVIVDVGERLGLQHFKTILPYFLLSCFSIHFLGFNDTKD